ncbi:MAG: hypothetical protein M5R38_15175 [Candidatus Methylomirabilis sp.]|nr:hypothetical protein [Candidatus Methylomirabilis sp.]
MSGQGWERTLGILAVFGVAAGLYTAFVYAPPDAVQGEVQRLMYLHVPLILVGYLAFLWSSSQVFCIYGVVIGGMTQLRTPPQRSV